MDREKNLVKNTIIYAVGTFGTRFISFIMLPLYTFYLTTKDYGFYDLITTSLALLVPVITLQLDNGVYRFLLDCKDDENKTNVISSSILTVMLSILSFNILYIILTNTIINFNFKFLILILINISVLDTIFAQIVRGLKYNVIYSINGVIFTLIMVISNIILLSIFKLGVEALIYSNIFANIVSLFYLNHKAKIINYIKINYWIKNLISDMLKYSIPLIANTISWWVMNVSDRFIINYYLGTSANGIYAVANKLPSIITIINYVFYLAWQETGILEYKSEDKSKFYSKMFKNYMNLQFTIVLILLCTTQLIFRILINAKFNAAYQYIPFLYLGALLYGFSSFYGVVYDSSKKTKSEAFTAIAGALFNILFNIIMVPYWGIQAASFSTMVAFLIMWILRVYDTKKYINIKIERVSIGIFILLSLIYTYIYYNKNLLLNILAILVSLFIFIIYNIALIKRIVIMVKSKIQINMVNMGK
ncbi:MAG: hypothetical protein PWP67_788 [Clostridium butyricum]|nr:hypothetical protein [Thermoanaerobacterium sp.]MDK2827988.1 hypothetical protein [Clostridium butyricum]